MPKGVQGFKKGHPVYSTRGNFKKGHKTWNKGLHKFLGGGFQKGKKHAKWNGGKFISKRGYIYVFKPNHPFAIYGGRYVAEHRLIVEKYLGRYLTKKEVVHHINGITDDNRIENLIAFKNHSSHKRFHKNNNNVKPEEIIFDGRHLT